MSLQASPGLVENSLGDEVIIGNSGDHWAISIVVVLSKRGPKKIRLDFTLRKYDVSIFWSFFWGVV